MNKIDRTEVQRTWLGFTDEEFQFVRNATGISKPREAFETYLAQCIHADDRRNAITVDAIRERLIDALVTDETIKSLVKHMGDQAIESEQGKLHSFGVANMYVKALIREKNAYKELCQTHGLALAKNPGGLSNA